MSGGSYNYAYSTIENEYVGRMHDKELDVMMKDLSKILKELEWWQSDDTSEDKYRDEVKKFKKKWFVKDNRIKNLEEIINIECEKLKIELINMIGG